MAIKGNLALTESAMVQFFRYILLLCSIIPVSMKVNQDLSKLFFARRIAMDKEMLNVTPRNSMIAEDLGRIEYFLTDKTGTLTKNEMILKNLSLGDSLLDTDKTNQMGDIGRRAAKGELLFEGELNMDQKFYRMLASILTCHAVFPVMVKGERTLESVSPDELSFIEFAEKIGFRLHTRNDHMVSFKDPNDQYFEFKILQIFPFTSSRKRMGLILEYKDVIYYFLKGADSAMVPFLKPDQRDKALEHTALLSGKGLRTLVFSQGVIEKEVYEAWAEKYRVAQAALEDRKEKMEETVNELEKDMEFLGITAVEDLLQDDVAICIETLRQAGIKVWMLTGDKMQTAKSISLTTGLYNKLNDKLYTLSGITGKDEMTQKLKELSNQVQKKNLEKEGKKVKLPITQKIERIPVNRRHVPIPRHPPRQPLPLPRSRLQNLLRLLLSLRSLPKARNHESSQAIGQESAGHRRRRQRRRHDRRSAHRDRHSGQGGQASGVVLGLLDRRVQGRCEAVALARQADLYQHFEDEHVDHAQRDDHLHYAVLLLCYVLFDRYSTV
jgi:magnesium-transporting ATPase (P-type)